MDPIDVSLHERPGSSSSSSLGRTPSKTSVKNTGPDIIAFETGSRQFYSDDDDSQYDEYAAFDDPNLDHDHIEEDLEDESPYPEVRSAVANTDDPELPCATLRVWLIGIPLAVILAGINQLLHFRYPAPWLNQIVAQLISFPLGCLAARILPHKTLFGVSLNPGPFTIKEHVLLTVISSVGARSAYATDIIAVQRITYNQKWSFSYQWMLVMSTQLIGFSLGGIVKRFLVSPPSMIWPNNLVSCALFNTLHSQQYSGVGTRQGIPRERFFLYIFVASAVWYIFPGYLFTALSFFSWMCWIFPKNVTVNQIFGYYSGLGMSLVTFDWAQVVFGFGSPLATPWWAQVNIVSGFVVFFWIMVPILYYTNTWFAKYMPISSRGAYDNLGHEYNVSKILKDNTFDEAAYKAYSPIFISTTFAVSYGLSFAAITSLIVHTFLYYRRQIMLQMRRSLREQPDIHARLMARYRQVPEWWYGIIFLVTFLFGVLSITLWETQMPVWAFVLALLMAFLYIVPVGMVQAITNQQVALNVITELVIGYMVPGKPIAMMMFKTWGYIGLDQAITFTSDNKLGHYMKISPIPMFFGQVAATAVTGTVQLGVQSWMFSNIPNICDEKQSNLFICANTEVFSTASIIWGVIGPRNQFSPGKIYYPLTFFFVLGAVAPIVAWLMAKRWPNSFIRYINMPVLFGGTGIIPPASAVNFVPWAIVGFIFQFFVRRRHFGWWTKYNYVLSAALDAGVAISAILLFFTLQYPKGGKIPKPNWWGNDVHERTLDYEYVAYLNLGKDEVFGPPSGSW